jgi:hypothetical protein
MLASRQICSIKKSEIKELPDPVLSLISMGQYTLYKAEFSKNPEVFYALRVSAKQIFLLTKDGEAIEFEKADLEKLRIGEKVTIEDVTPPIIARNLGMSFGT